MFEKAAALGIRSSGRVVGVKAFGIARRGHELVLRAHVAGEVSSDVDGGLASVRECVVAAFTAGRAPRVIVEVVPFVGDEAAIFVDQPVMIGQTAWSVEADTEQARSIFALVAELDGNGPLGSPHLERWSDALLRDVRRGLPFDPEFQPVTISDGMLTVSEGHYGWVTSYEQGWIATERFSVPCAALPARTSIAAQFVRKVEQIVAKSKAQMDEPSRTTECTYCKKTFAPLDFNSRVRACHGCAEAHCGVVY